MDISTSIATSRLMAQQRAMDVTASNMANANTPGYKLQRVQFSDWLSRQTGIDAPRGGKTIAFTQDRATWRDHQAGTLTHTANPLDLAITSDGYFTVNTSRGPRLTRDGRFGLMPNGTLADGSGNAVLGTNGQPIQFSPSDTRITIAGDGTVSTQNGQLGKIGVVTVANQNQLVSEGGTLYRADAATSAVPSPGILQGAVENSNVQPVLEITRMMQDVRQFQFVSQYIQAESDRQQNAIDKLLPATGS
jgi:flagellar basal-body rod protein FlgF